MERLIGWVLLTTGIGLLATLTDFSPIPYYLYPYLYNLDPRVLGAWVGIGNLVCIVCLVFGLWYLDSRNCLSS